MFNSITNAQDGFYRHHNAKPSVRRSVLYYQFFPSICLGGASNPGSGENTQKPIFGLLYSTIIYFSRFAAPRQYMSTSMLPGTPPLSR